MLRNLTINQINRLLKRREASAVEITKDYLKRAKDLNKRINAIITLMEDYALTQAKEVDKLLDNDIEISPLAGVPLAVKDNILIEGEKCTAASKILENYIATYDATVIKKLKELKVIFLSKTNLDEFAMGSSTENSFFGPTKNPFDETRVPGGSSGGSAAAVALDMAVCALGSDTGGSIRQPAAFCGIVGLKPTYGRVSRYGLIAMASSLDQIGPLTKNVEDAEILFKAIAGKDKFDSTTVDEDIVLKNQRKIISIKDLKIGVPKEYFGKGLDADIEKLIKEKIKELEMMGAKVKEISLPYSSYALAVYYLLMPAEVSANLARFDGIRYGFSKICDKKSDDMSIKDIYFSSRTEGFGNETRRRIMLGTYVLSRGYYDAYYLKALRMRNLIKRDFDKAFDDIDLIITPTTPTPPFKIGEKINDPLKMYLEDIYTVPVNIAGLPAMSLPIGFVERDGNKLPVGLQIIAPPFCENLLFEIGKIIEKL